MTPTLVLSLRVLLCRHGKGLMAPSISYNDGVQGEVFLPGQIFVFGSFVLRANSFGHLEQIESYAPSRQIRFGSLNYTANIRGDLIFDGFEPAERAALSRWARSSSAAKQCSGGRTSVRSDL